MKLSRGEGGEDKGIHTKGVMVARYNPWVLLVVLLSGRLYCLLFQIKNPNVCPVPINIYVLKSYGLYSISCTVLVIFIINKSILLSTYNLTTLLV